LKHHFSQWKLHLAIIMKEWVSLLTVSAQADAKVDDGNQSEGADAAATVVSGVKIYQMTDTGIALQATLQGTKYWKNDDLN